MKQFYIFITMLTLVFNINSMQAQTVEFSYDITSVLPDDGLNNTGIVFINNQFWVSEWNSNDIHVLDNVGNYIETFQIAGVTNTRSMTTDGTSVYCVSVTSNIYEVDPITKNLISTITITTSSNVVARVCAYDASLNSSSGGFWVANWNTDIVSIDMTGNELSVIDAATHGLQAMSGGAIDGIGNLYLYNQDGANTDSIAVIDLSTGTPTGVEYDVFTNISSPLGATSSVSGGLFFSDEVVSGKIVAIGLSQGNPDNILFGVDFGTGLSVEYFTLNNKIKLYPNPSNNHISISELTNSEAYTISNLLGAKMKNGTVSNNEKIDISDLTNGLYFIAFENGNTLKFIKE